MAAAVEGPDDPPHALNGLAIEGFLPHGPQQRHRQGNASRTVGILYVQTGRQIWRAENKIIEEENKTKETT